MLKHFISYYKPHKKLFFLDMLFALIMAGCDLFYPMIARNMINIYVPEKQLGLLIRWSVALLVIYIIKSYLNYALQYWGHILGVRIQGDMRMDMFSQLQKLPFSYFDENKTGTIMSRLVEDLKDISELAHHGPEDLFLSLITLIGSFFILSSINLYLTLIIYIFIPIMILFAVKMRKKMNDAFRESREEIAEVNANIESSISGMRVSRAYTAAPHEIKRFGSSNDKFKAARSKAYKIMGIFYGGMNFFSDILYLIILFTGGLFFYYGKIQVGDFAAFLLYTTMFLKPINRLVMLFEQFQDGITGFKRFREIMEVAAEPESPGAVDPGSLKGDIYFDSVSFSYTESNDQSYILSNLSLKIEAGKTIALVGPSGGGKTTLCHLVPRFYELSSGIISIDGIDIRDMQRLALRRNIGMVAQDVFLFNGTIRENIAYGRLDATDEEIFLAAKKANIHDFIMTLDNGYQTNVGERGVKLSGGQKQRISIARVFLKDPPILILDEATSALDNITEAMIQEALEDLSKGRTCIVVAHRLSTVKNADEIIVLTEKGVEERGSHSRLLDKNGIYASLYNKQFRDLII